MIWLLLLSWGATIVSYRYVTFRHSVVRLTLYLNCIQLFFGLAALGAVLLDPFAPATCFLGELGLYINPSATALDFMCLLALCLTRIRKATNGDWKRVTLYLAFCLIFDTAAGSSHYLVDSLCSI